MDEIRIIDVPDSVSRTLRGFEDGENRQKLRLFRMDSTFWDRRCDLEELEDPAAFWDRVGKNRSNYLYFCVWRQCPNIPPQHLDVWVYLKERIRWSISQEESVKGVRCLTSREAIWDMATWEIVRSYRANMS